MVSVAVMMRIDPPEGKEVRVSIVDGMMRVERDHDLVVDLVGDVLQSRGLLHVLETVLITQHCGYSINFFGSFFSMCYWMGVYLV